MDGNRFTGLFIPSVTPFNSDGSLDLAGMRKLAGYFAGIEGVSGVVSAARIGEGPVLSEDEKLAVFQTVGEVVHGAGKTHIATILPQSTDQAVGMVRRLAPLPVDAVMIFPPLLLAWGQVPSAMKVQFFRDVAAASPVPMVLFQVPVASYWYTVDEVCDIAAIPGVVAFKEASFNFQLFADTVRALKRQQAAMKVLTGNDRFVAESYRWGADGALIGVANVATGLWAQLDLAGRRGDEPAVARISEQLQTMKELVFAEPIVEAVSRIKWILRSQGLIASAAVRRPQLGISEAEARTLLEKYAELAAV